MALYLGSHTFEMPGYEPIQWTTDYPLDVPHSGNKNYEQERNINVKRLDLP